MDRQANAAGGVKVYIQLCQKQASLFIPHPTPKENRLDLAFHSKRLSEKFGTSCETRVEKLSAYKWIAKLSNSIPVMTGKDSLQYLKGMGILIL